MMVKVWLTAVNVMKLIYQNIREDSTLILCDQYLSVLVFALCLNVLK